MMKFTKMHGIGNDYVYVDCTKQELGNPEGIARFVSDRHFGIGADGLILIKNSDVADFCMDMYNADGSRGEMCGNGIRCVAKYVYDYGLTDKTQISVNTKSGIKYLDLTVEDGKVAMVVDGSWQAAELPLFDGTYTVTPSAEGEVVLAAAQKLMDANVVVEKIPFAEVTNSANGKTATIG